MQRPIHDHPSSQKARLTNLLLQPANLTDLCWLVHVVQAGSFSAAAVRTGIAKSNLSRRIIQLEKRMDLQLLVRQPRALRLTPTGSLIYRHALDILKAAEAVEQIVRETGGLPRGPLSVCAPRVLSDWLYPGLRTFKEQHPHVDIRLTQADDEADLENNELDISLSLHGVSSRRSDIVSRALARLERVIVGSPDVVERLGNPPALDRVDDQDLLVTRSATGPHPWELEDTERSVHKVAMCFPDYQSMIEGARAGLGLACVPLHSCIADLRTGKLLLTCKAERPKAAVLYILSNPHRRITPAARALIQHLRDSLLAESPAGLMALESDTAACP